VRIPRLMTACWDNCSVLKTTHQPEPASRVSKMVIELLLGSAEIIARSSCPSRVVLSVLSAKASLVRLYVSADDIYRMDFAGPYTSALQRQHRQPGVRIMPSRPSS
jgi:hypothetical protein